jgi:hypothetical protein
MARYRRPPDPRKGEWEVNQPPTGSDQKPEKNPFPWLWLGLGLVVTIVGIFLAGALITALLSREPLATTLPTPTIIRLTAPPSPVPTDFGPLASATPIPTFTPLPTPDLSVAPNEVTVGFYAQVFNTDDIGVSLRGGPSTDNVRLQLIPENTLLLVIGGPAEGNGFIWWQVLADDELEGWVAGDFLTPASAQSQEE